MSRLQQLFAEHGQSPWLDNIKRSYLGSGELARLVVAGIRGVTANPTIFEHAIAGSAALAAAALEPRVVGYLVGGHRSQEPGATVALRTLRLDPLVDLDLRLGEGSGALLAVPIVQAAARMLTEVATFESAQVSER